MSRLPNISPREAAYLSAAALAATLLGWFATRVSTAILWPLIGAVAGVLTAGTILAVRRLYGSVRRLRRAVGRLAARDQLTRRIASLDDDVAELRRRLTSYIELEAGVTDELYATVHSHRSRLARLRDDVEEIRGATSKADKRLVTQYRGSALSHAYALSARRHPRRLILLMTVERSGSTALFDLLRSHSDVYVEPLSFLWEELGSDGRRYPTNLTDQGGYTMPLEVQPGIGGRIPVIGDSVSLDWSGTIAIEKAHPQFFDYNPGRLLEGIGRMKSAGTEVSVIIQVRRPLEVMWSMAEYKQREPSWYRDLDPADIPDHVLRSLVSLGQFVALTPDVVVIDNEDLATISKRFTALLGQLVGIDETGASAWAENHLGRVKTVHSRTKFIAERDSERRREGPEGIWAASGGTIDEATRLWEQLVAR